MAHAQRILSRRKKGSSNWNKQRIKVARIHERIAHARKDYLNKNFNAHHQKNHDVIAIEDLQVANMLKKTAILQKPLVKYHGRNFARCWNTKQSGMGSKS
ncbi:hypothetical protein GCM10020331_092050 [Ectobacillus funiculus]